jgi:hypothetical protein
MKDKRRFENKRTARYEQAVAALQALLEEGGLDAVSRAYGEATWQEEERQFRVINKLTPLKGHRCVPRLRGQRCPGKYHYMWDKVPVQDHSSDWKKDGKPYCVVSQPYPPLSTEDLKAILDFCGDDLEVSISTDSWWFPGRTLRIVYYRKGAT